MPNEFASLNDKELEDLARDLLSKEMQIQLQSFKMGIDQGIDLRYATPTKENEIIVQVKHFIGSGVSKLKSSLKAKELTKIKKLNPKRYLLVTSLPLSPKNKEDIKALLSPFILSTGDILGKDDLNGLLVKYPEIEEANFKLWLSSSAIIKRIIKNAVTARSEFTAKRIGDRIKLFVPNQTHSKAVSTLNLKNFILIVGAPGIGKTTLANILSYQLLATGFELVYVTEIKEAEEVFNLSKKQVFYFDDFLGTITLDLTSSRNADASIVNFVERIKNDKNKRLILTCRTTILNQALDESEKLNNSKIEISKHEVKIEDYNELDKAKILYNHIYYSNLSESQKNVFFNNGFYWQVIKHPNYNPRVIEFFTDQERLQKGEKYQNEIISFLNNPERIWEKSYEKQISENSRIFLGTMFSFGNRYVIEEHKLKIAYDARIEYEIKNTNHRPGSNAFNKALKELLGAFILRIHKTENSRIDITYKFLNPSVEDFLSYYFRLKNLNGYLDILRSAKYFEQLKARITTDDKKDIKLILFKNENYHSLLKLIVERMPFLKSNGSNSNLDEIITLLNLFKWEDIKNIILPNLENLNIKYLNWHDRDYLIETLDYLATNELLSIAKLNLEEIFLKLSENLPSYFQILSFSDVISKHKVYVDFIANSITQSPSVYLAIQKNINEGWNNHYGDYISNAYHLKEITELTKLTETINERRTEAINASLKIHLSPSPIIETYDFDYKSQIESNLKYSLINKDQITDFRKNSDQIVNPKEINRLFNASDNIRLELPPF